MKNIKRIKAGQFCDLLYARAVAEGKLGYSFNFEGKEISVDYYLTVDYGEDFEFSDYTFDLQSTVSFGGSEGIYVDIFTDGVVNEEDTAKSRSIGTIKSLCEDKKTMEALARLCGTITYDARKLVEGLSGRFSPAEEIERDFKRAEKKGLQKFFFCLEQNKVTEENGYIIVLASSQEKAEQVFLKSLYKDSVYRICEETQTERLDWLDYIVAC